ERNTILSMSVRVMKRRLSSKSNGLTLRHSFLKHPIKPLS
ncbi:MAG: hypothetical protein ACI90A_000839, partial [Shewanella sp.]